MSIINVFARIRSSFQGENGEKLKLLEEKPEVPASGTVDISPEKFDLIFEGKQKSEELYQESFGSLVRPFLNGHNVATMLFGESNSGKLSTLFGGEIGNLLKPNKKSMGMLVLLVNELFSAYRDGESQSDEKPFIKMTVIEVRNKVMLDLLTPNNNGGDDSKGVDTFSAIFTLKIKFSTSSII